ncbi:Gfo/Idh/MocA family protein [Gorillibacterium massiliense]|uniref:Gfo/Idh/MocA family protein n=1 Tax=Gorillibacterium massiliense TaxID=1280390 RepID=UPI0004B3AF70|nr:Gfo/Idh/MocA family oxidoreductase [Gorillibacterium massiliense]
MKIGVLGTGFGAYHAQVLSKMEWVDHIVVFGRNREKLLQLKKELGVETTTCIEDILHDPGIDVVDNCLPSHLHRQYSIEALKNGKHVFCETPVCLSLEDAQAMNLAVEQYKKRILVNQFIKFSPAYQYLYDAVKQQTFGNLISLSVVRETPPIWGELGLSTISTNLMIHDIDFIVWILGIPERLTVWGREMMKEGQSQVRAFFNYRDTVAEVTGSSHMPESYPFTVGFQAYFEKAKLEYSGAFVGDRFEETFYEYTGAGKQKVIPNGGDPYEKAIEHALHCFEKDADSVIELNEAIRSLEIAVELKNRLMQNRPHSPS